jgi:hypothetical protein
MSKRNALITEDKDYKPADPEMPERRFYIETDQYRWKVYIRTLIIRETGTPVYYGSVENEHSAYGLTRNEILNDLASILIMKSEVRSRGVKAVSLNEVRHFLDPSDVVREERKITGHRSVKSILAGLLGW